MWWPWWWKRILCCFNDCHCQCHNFTHNKHVQFFPTECSSICMHYCVVLSWERKAGPFVPNGAATFIGKKFPYFCSSSRSRDCCSTTMLSCPPWWEPPSVSWEAQSVGSWWEVPLVGSNERCHLSAPDERYHLSAPGVRNHLSAPDERCHLSDPDERHHLLTNDRSTIHLIWCNHPKLLIG